MDEQQAQDQQHEEWLASIAVELAPVFEHSTEGVYVYLDDRHKICNDKLATLWGYRSAAEWAAAPDFLNSFVATHADRAKVSTNYHRHIHQLLSPARVRFTVRRPDGKTVRCEADMVPYAHAGQMFAYAFVRPLAGTRRATATRLRVKRPKRVKRRRRKAG